MNPAVAGFFDTIYYHVIPQYANFSVQAETIRDKTRTIHTVQTTTYYL